jgi:cytochrome c oxidase assembly factor CtaG
VGIAIAQNLVLAVLIGFAQVPLYAPYVHLFQSPGGLSTLQDQQLGAGIMWTFGDLPFGIAFSILVHHWLASQSDDAGSAIQPHYNAVVQVTASPQPEHEVSSQHLIISSPPEVVKENF